MVLVGLTACAAPARKTPELSGGLPRRDFTALYKIRWTDGQKTRKARLAVAWLHPERLRMEILGPLGGTSAALIIANSEGAALLFPARRSYARFETGRDALRTLTGLPLEPSLLPAILLSDFHYASRFRCNPSASSSMDERVCVGPQGDPIVTVYRETGRAIIRFQSGTGIEVLRPAAGEGPGHPAREIRFEEIGGPIRLELSLRDEGVDAPALDLFTLEPPPGFRVESEASASPLLGEGWP